MEPVAELRQTTRTVLVLAHNLVREAMARTLDDVDGVTIVGQTGAADEVIDIVRKADPTLVMVDADLRSGDATELVRLIRRESPQTVVGVIAEDAPPHLVERALTSGASGFLLKDVAVERFAEDVQRLGKGDTVLHPKAASALASGFVGGTSDDDRPRLTPRQREVLRLLAMGLENKQIARQLGIGIHTVKTHVSRVLEKLGASSRTEAVVVAMKERLIG